MIEARNSLTISRGSRAAIVGISLAAILMSCSNLLTGNDIKTKIGTDVAAANAASVTVTINANPATGGTLSLSGTQTEKVGVPFTLTATVYDAYVFGGWTATGSGNVTFSAANAATTTVTVGTSASDIVINANFTARPVVKIYSPAAQATGIVTNQPITVTFSKAMNATSFSQNGNITVTSVPTGGGTGATTTTLFSSGTTSLYFGFSSTSTGFTLTPLISSPKIYMPPNSTISVAISPLVTDSAGNTMDTLNPFAGWYFFTSSSSDSSTPTVSLNGILNGGSISSPAAVALPLGTYSGDYAVNSSSITLNTIGTGTVAAPVSTLTITETDTTTGTSKTITDGYSESYVYSLQTTNEGEKSLSYYVTNSIGTKSSIGTVKIYYDHTAPAISVAVLSSTGSWAKQGSLITLTFTALDNICASDGAPATGLASTSPVVTMKSGGNAITGTGANAPSITNIGSAFTWTYYMQPGDTDGAITYSIAASDVAGNAATPLTTGTGSVTYDHTAPTIGGATLSSSTGTSWAKQGSMITLAFTASDSGSGLASGSPAVTVKSGGNAITGTGANAPSITNVGSAFTWTYYMQSGDSEGAITYSIAASDVAGNAATPVTTGTGSVTYDHTAPSIYLSGANQPLTTGTSNPTLSVTLNAAEISGLVTINYWPGTTTSEATAKANSQWYTDTETAVTVNGGTFTTATLNSAINGTDFRFTVVDAAGNESSDAYLMSYSSGWSYLSESGKALGMASSSKVSAARITPSSYASSRAATFTPVFTDTQSTYDVSQPDQAAAPSKAPSAAMQPVSYNYSTTGATRSAPVDSSGLSLLQRTNRSTTTTGQAPAMPVRYAGTPASAASSSRTAGTSGAPASETAVNARAAAPTAAGLQAAAQGSSDSASSQGSASAPVKGASPAGQKTPAPVNNSVPRPDLFVGQARQRRDEASEESWDDEE